MTNDGKANKTTEAAYIEAARRIYADESDDDIEIDSDAVVSEVEGGAFVQAWVWVPNSDVLCPVCGITIELHVDGVVPGMVFQDGIGEIACEEYEK